MAFEKLAITHSGVKANNNNISHYKPLRFSFNHKKNLVLLSHIYIHLFIYFFFEAINRLFRPAQENNEYKILTQI